jgi:predicted hydrocarbon binding protein
MQYALRDVLEREFGSSEATRLFYRAGNVAGMEFYRHLIGEMTDLDGLLRRLQTLMEELGIGLLRVEEVDLEQGRIVLTVSEDLDCSGVPETGFPICAYDEGFIAAILESFAGGSFSVHEVDCWSTGNRTCRFLATVDDVTDPGTSS